MGREEGRGRGMVGEKVFGFFLILWGKDTADFNVSLAL